MLNSGKVVVKKDLHPNLFWEPCFRRQPAMSARQWKVASR